ncbi:hypothetical protein [Klebsiella phage pKP-BM327-1.2]|nr:hypothetical protein [Klebsiella phage pKP-BM327-1.2]
MKPVVKDVMHDLRKLLPVAEQALSTQTMKLDERVTAISQWRELTSPAMIIVLLDRIDQLEKLWLEPTEQMVNAGLAEIQTWLDNLNELRINQEGSNGYIDPELVTDEEASDAAVFTLQAMAGKLPKEPD